MPVTTKMDKVNVSSAETKIVSMVFNGVGLVIIDINASGKS